MKRGFILWLCLLASAACGTNGAPSPSPTPDATATSPETVRIYLSTGNTEDCAEVTAVEREVGGRPTLSTAMEQLLAGPTAEEQARGLGGWFSEETSDMLVSAEISDGVARVDFKDLREVIPNASSSCGSAMLLAQLDATARQFGVSRTLYSINGDLDTFYNWLQMGTPEA